MLMSTKANLSPEDEQLRKLLRLRVVAEHKCKAEDELNADKIWVHFQVCPDPGQSDLSGYCCRLGDQEVELPVDEDVVAPAATPESKISHMRALNEKVNENKKDATTAFGEISDAVDRAAKGDNSVAAVSLEEALRRTVRQVELQASSDLICRMDMSDLRSCQDPFAFLISQSFMIESLRTSIGLLNKGLACLAKVPPPKRSPVGGASGAAEAARRSGLRLARALWRSRYLMMAGVVAYQGVEPLIAELKASGVNSMLRDDVAAAFPVVMEGLVKHIACPVLYHPMLMMKLVQATVQHLLKHTAGFLEFLQSRFDAAAIDAVKDAVDGVRDLNGAGAAAESAYALLATFAHDFWISVASAVCPEGAGLPSPVPPHGPPSEPLAVAGADEVSDAELRAADQSPTPPPVDRPKRALSPRHAEPAPSTAPPSKAEASDDGSAAIPWFSGAGFSDACLRSSEEIHGTEATTPSQGWRSWFGGGGDTGMTAGARKVAKAAHEAKQGMAIAGLSGYPVYSKNSKVPETVDGHVTREGMPMAGLSGYPVYGKSGEASQVSKAVGAHARGEEGMPMAGLSGYPVFSKNSKAPDAAHMHVTKEGMTIADLSGWTVHSATTKAAPEGAEAAATGRPDLVRSFVQLFKRQEDELPAGARSHGSFWGGVSAEQIARRLHRGRIPTMPGTIVNDDHGIPYRVGTQDPFEGLRIMDGGLVELEGDEIPSSLLDAEQEARGAVASAFDVGVSVEEFMQRAETMNLLGTLLVATFDSFSAFFPSKEEPDKITEVTQTVATGEDGKLQEGEACERDSQCSGGDATFCIQALDSRGRFKEGPKTCSDFVGGRWPHFQDSSHSSKLTVQIAKDGVKLLGAHVRNLVGRTCEEAAPA